MGERLRVLLVGTDGAGGQEHQRLMYEPAFAAHDAFEVVGAVDDLADDAGAVLDGVDVACVCAAYERRESVVATLAERGVHLLVDKPLALSARQARRLAAAVEGRGLVAMPAHHLRFHPSVGAAAAAVTRGDVGLPWAVQGEFLAAEGTGAWPHGELANFLCYPLDVVRAILALEPRQVAAWRSSPFFDSPHEDLGVLSLTFEREVPVSLTVGRTPVRGHRNGAAGEHRYRVMGTEGVLTVDLAAPSLRVDGPARSRPFGRSSVAALLDHLAAAVRGEVRPALGFADAVVVADVVEAARSAADNATVVSLDEMTGA